MKTDDEMRDILRKAVLKAGGQTAWGERNGETQQYVSALLSNVKPMTKRIARKLGYPVRRWHKE